MLSCCGTFPFFCRCEDLFGRLCLSLWCSSCGKTLASLSNSGARPHLGLILRKPCELLAQDAETFETPCCFLSKTKFFSGVDVVVVVKQDRNSGLCFIW